MDEDDTLDSPTKIRNRQSSLNHFNNYLTFIGHDKSYDQLITDDLTHNLYSQFGDYLIFDAKISCGTALQYLSGVKGWIEENHRSCSFLADKKWLRSIRTTLQQKHGESQQTKTPPFEDNMSIVQDLSAVCTKAFTDFSKQTYLEGRAFLAMNWACSGERGY